MSFGIEEDRGVEVKITIEEEVDLQEQAFDSVPKKEIGNT